MFSISAIIPSNTMNIYNVLPLKYGDVSLFIPP